MSKSAGRTIVVADHSKLGHNALGTIVPIQELDLIISDIDAPEEIVERLIGDVEVRLV